MPDESTRHGDEKATRSDQAQVFDELLAAYASTAGIAILDSEYRYLWVNQQLAALNGVQPSEHLGKTVREVIGQIADEIESYLQRVFSTGESILNVEISGASLCEKKDGTPTPALLPDQGGSESCRASGCSCDRNKGGKKAYRRRSRTVIEDCASKRFGLRH